MRRSRAMTTNARETFKSSELSRSSAEVFAAAADHPITVTRRDGEPLVLMSQREDHARNELLRLAAKLIGVSIIEDSQLVRLMTEQFPWMLALSPEIKKPVPGMCSMLLEQVSQLGKRT